MLKSSMLSSVILLTIVVLCLSTILFTSGEWITYGKIGLVMVAFSMTACFLSTKHLVAMLALSIISLIGYILYILF